MIVPQRSAALLVEVWAIGVPGKVAITVANAPGRALELLSPAEAVRVLRDAANIIEEKPELLR